MRVTDSKVQAAFMLLLAITINLAFLYGLIARPVISYHLSTPLDYNGTIDFDAEELRVEFKTMNRGFSPARVWLVARVYNMSLLGAGALSVEEEDGVSVLRVPWDAPARQSEYEVFEVKLESTANATYLVLIFSVEGDWQAKLYVRFHNSFAIYKPERPTALLLKHVRGSEFMRVRRR